jgi:hypothetical protein
MNPVQCFDIDQVSGAEMNLWNILKKNGSDDIVKLEKIFKDTGSVPKLVKWLEKNKDIDLSTFKIVSAVEPT